MTRHIHADLIKAWADGAEIEYLNEALREWRDAGSPVWSPATKYRVKHPLQALIDARDLGATIQVRMKGDPYSVWKDDSKVKFDSPDSVEYRIKPDVLKYRRCIRYKAGRRSGGAENMFVDCVESLEDATYIESNHRGHSDRFVRWIDTEWQEVEL